VDVITWWRSNKDRYVCDKKVLEALALNLPPRLISNRMRFLMDNMKFLNVQHHKKKGSKSDDEPKTMRKSTDIYIGESLVATVKEHFAKVQ
jgi:hypothetical protein